MTLRVKDKKKSFLMFLDFSKTAIFKVNHELYLQNKSIKLIVSYLIIRLILIAYTEPATTLLVVNRTDTMSWQQILL